MWNVNPRPRYAGATCPNGGHMRLSGGRGRIPKGPGSSRKQLVFCTCMAQMDRSDIPNGQWNYDHLAVIDVSESALDVFRAHCEQAA